jgi:universal stress protein A
MKAKPTRRPGAVTLEISRSDEPLMDAATLTAVRSPFKLERILVPIDFSDCSQKALQYALPLAREHGAAIALVYVVPPPEGVSAYAAAAMDFDELEASLKTAAEKELQKLARHKMLSQVATTSVVRVGSPAREIVEAARKLPADLIVISTHGRTGLNHVLLGSVAEHVVQRAPCPVLVVREREHEILAS